MDVLDRLLSALGHILLAIASALVVEELTFAGLARLLLSRIPDRRSRRSKTNGGPGGRPHEFSTQHSKEIHTNELQGGNNART